MKRSVGFMLSLIAAGFAAAWVCLRSLLPFVLLLALPACVPAIAGGIAGGVAGASLGAVVARGVASAAKPGEAVAPVPLVPEKPQPEEWRDLDAADAAAKAVR